MSGQWTSKAIGDLTGKTVVVTGASSGIGLETALTLAGKGADMILAVRNMAKGKEAIKKIKLAYPYAKTGMMELDLSDLNSIRLFAKTYRERYDTLSILINNAGVMMPPYRQTKDGFELQFGSNHLGHFALTGLLLPCLIAAPQSRVVTLSSLAANSGNIDFNNLDGKSGYQAMKFYSQSKLANLLFARELQNKFDAHGIKTISVACHPGFAHTNLASRGSGRPVNGLFKIISKVVSQPAAMGALPTLYAAAEPFVSGGEYIGPDGKGGRKGYPMKDGVVETLYDREISEKLWMVSEKLTGITYEFSQSR
jgi:NAD(P)-dependent dehydrogenase (short-subunit alcohol dehydrogenase family)